MKTLELNQMENLHGGTERDCFVRGVATSVFGIIGFVFPPAFLAAGMVVATSADCF